MEEPQMSEQEQGELNKRIETVEKERQEYLDGWRRAKADFINYKKEEAERFTSIAKFANESLLLELILILDSFTLGLSVLKNDKDAEKGMGLVKLQLEEVLKRHGLEKITISLGKQFDPTTQEAVGEVVSGSPPGTVAEVAEDGYTLNGKVLRAAKVKLSKNKSKEK